MEEELELEREVGLEIEVGLSISANLFRSFVSRVSVASRDSTPD